MKPLPPLPDRIQWHEGMLLSPQHFQQESARVDELVAWHGLATHPHAWGVHQLSIDPGLLASGVLRVVAFSGVLPDGTSVQLNPDAWGDEPLELDLSPWDAEMERGEVAVYLSLGRNPSIRDPGQNPRYRPMQAMPVEDHVSEALAVDIPRLRPLLRLSAHEVPSSVMVSLKLATVRKENEVVRLGDFQPALLNIESDHPWRQRLQGLVTQQRSKAAFLARLCMGAASSRLEDRIELLDMRQRLNGLSLHLPLLEALAWGPYLHPYALYMALCAQMGAMATLKPGALPGIPQAWNQADPGQALEPLLQAVESALGEVSQSWRTLPFRLEQDRYTLDLPSGLLGQRLVVGLRGMAERELVAWMSMAVIGSASVWASLGDRRVLGAARKPIDEAPELGLKGGTGYTLFAVEAQAEFIQADQSLVISNPHESGRAVRPQDVVLFIKG